MYPSHYNEIVWIMGPLHIEMAFLSAIGNFLEGCGWTETLEKTNINTPGRVDSLLDGGKFKRSYYAHQISLAALFNLLNEAFKSQPEITIYEK